MLRPSKKISKRELKQDALITTYAQVTTFYNTYRRAISIGLTVLVVAAAAVFFYMRNMSTDSETARTQLSEVRQFYDNGQYQVAIDGVPERNIKGLRSIVDNFGRTGGGNLARYYLANAYFQLGKYDEALKEFENYSSGEELLESSRLAGIAGCYEATGMYREAAENFEKAAAVDPKDLNAADHLGGAARNYARAGDKAKAIDLYKKVKKNYPASGVAREADLYIAELSV